MSEIEIAALVWYKARLRQSSARDALRAYRGKHGSCTVMGGNTGRGPCYEYPGQYEPWCEVCSQSQLIYKERRQSATQAGVALKSLMRLCKARLADEQHS